MASMASNTNPDGLSTIHEIKTGAYIWFVVILIISSAMAYKFAQIDLKLYSSKNKYIDGDMHRENRLSSATIPQAPNDHRNHVEFTEVTQSLGK